MKVTMAHGSGGASTSELIENIFARHFKNEYLDRMEHVYDGEFTVAWRTKFLGIDKLELDGVTFYFIDNQEYFDGLTNIMKEKSPFPMGADDPKFRNVLRNATAAIAVACPDDESGMCLINVGLLCENVCLAAKSLGLGSVVMAGPVMMMNSIPEAKPFLDKLNFSEGYKLRVIVGLGYPDEEPDAKPRDLGKIQFVE